MNHILGTLDFTGSVHRVPYNFFYNTALLLDSNFITFGHSDGVTVPFN